MKIAFVCGRDIERANDTDGGSVLIQNIARELAQQGNTIDVYTPSNVAAGTIRKEEPIRTFSIPGISMIRFPIQETNLDLCTSDEDSGYYFLNRMKISSHIGTYFDDGKLHAYDRVYLFHMAHAFGLFEKHRCPSERTILFPMLLGEFYRLFRTVPQEYIDAEKEALSRACHITTPSAAERSVLMKAYKVPSENIFVAHRGYDPTVFQPLLRTSIPHDHLHLLCANVIKPQKEQRFFLELAEAMRDRIPDFVIHLVGTSDTNAHAAYGKYARDLKREVTLRGLEQHIIFHDTMPQSALHELMRTCHLAFYPSRTETFGKSVLESVVTGLPTIAHNDVPAYAEFLENKKTGITIGRSLTEALETIDLLRADARLYQTISENGISTAPRFTWKTVIADFIRVSESRMHQ